MEEREQMHKNERGANDTSKEKNSSKVFEPFNINCYLLNERISEVN